MTVSFEWLPVDDQIRDETSQHPKYGSRCADCGSVLIAKHAQHKS